MQQDCCEKPLEDRLILRRFFCNASHHNMTDFPMKKIVLSLIATISVLCTPCDSQQYGWVDIGKNLPNSSGTVTLPDMYWVSENEGWICSGILGEIYHTTDGGKTFTTQTTQFYTNAIHMLNSKEGYAGGYNGRMYRTTDGGGTWTAIGTIGSSIRSISFPLGSSVGYCCGDIGKIYSVTSTGVNSMYSGVTANLRSISFPSSSYGWVCGISLIIRFDTAWFQQYPPAEGYNCIFMSSNTAGWAGGDLGTLVNTVDGTNWNYQNNPDVLKRSLNDVFFNQIQGWAVGTSGLILHTINGGATWAIEAAGMTSNMLRSVQFTSPANGYVLGNNKTLLKYGLLTDVTSDDLKVPGSFQLFQNYPNPFNPSTTISINLPSRSFASLKIFDALGKPLYSGKYNFSKGENNVHICNLNFADGMYLLKINVKDNSPKIFKFIR